MAGKARQIGLMDRRFLQALGGLALIGAALFFLDDLPLIGAYLGLAGIAFGLSSIGFSQRHARIASTVPDGYTFTGECVPNPPDSDLLEVWHRGINRIYVKAGSARE